jgi:hypothetical protein
MFNELRARVGDIQLAPADPAVFLLRPEYYEGPFLAAHSNDLHGAVLLGRHLAPFPAGSPGQLEGLRGDEMAQRVRAATVEHIHDPDTAVLPLLGSDGASKRFGRAHQMLSARSVPIGVRSADLAGDEALRSLVVATMQPQASVTLPAAPYFRYTSAGDPWLDVNLRAAEMTQAIHRGQPIVVYAQVDVVALRNGVLAQTARQYLQALGARGVVFLQVAGLDTERCGSDALQAYLSAVIAWRGAGFTVIADRVGRFGVAAVGAGASGTSSGTRVYRMLSDVELEHQYTRSGKVRYWVPERGDSLPVKDARKRDAKGSLPPCPIADCDVLSSDRAADEIRWHGIHLVMHELAAVRRDPAGFAGAWCESPRNYVRAWGQTLGRVIQRSEQA